MGNKLKKPINNTGVDDNDDGDLDTENEIKPELLLPVIEINPFGLSITEYMEILNHSNGISALLCFPPNIVVSSTHYEESSFFTLIINDIISEKKCVKRVEEVGVTKIIGITKYTADSFFVVSLFRLYGYRLEMSSSQNLIDCSKFYEWGNFRFDPQICCIHDSIFTVARSAGDYHSLIEYQFPKKKEASKDWRKLRRIFTDIRSVWKVSKKYPGKLFMTTSEKAWGGAYKIHQLNVYSGAIDPKVKKFSNSFEKFFCGHQQRIISLSFYRNENNEEMMIGGCEDEKCYIYNTEQEYENENKEEEQKELEKYSHLKRGIKDIITVFMELDVRDKPLSLLVLKNQFLIIGGSKSFQIFQIRKGKKQWEKIYSRSNIPSCTNLCSLNSEKKYERNLRIAYLEDKKNLKVVTFSSDILSGINDGDLIERTEWILHNLCEEIEIKFSSTTKFYVNRTILSL